MHYNSRRLDFLTRFSTAILFTAVLIPPAFSQQAYPMLMSIDPVAVQQGTTSDHIIKSRYTMEDAYEVLVSGEGIAGLVVLPEAKEGQKKPTALQSLTVRFTADAEATPGVRDFRIATPTGVSTTGQLVVVQDPLVVESGDNNTLDKANPITLPATICGRIEKAEDIDLFKFHAEAGDEVNFYVRCMRLQDKIHDLQQHADPMLSIRNGSGSTVAAADNVFAADPFLSHTFAETGDYYLELRDVRYQGNQYWCYSIEANQRPFVRTVFPLALSPKVSQPVKVVGQALNDGAPGTVSLRASATPGIHQALVSLAGDVIQEVDVVVTDQSTLEEVIEENNTIESGQSIVLPLGINGRIESAGDIDCYRFSAKKGERYTFEVTARRAGSPLDSHLRILSATGSQQQLNDDVRIGKRSFADSRIENWTVPSDGVYVIEVRDVNLRGGPAFVYFLSVTQCEPYFTLFADTDKTPLTPGTSGVIFVRAEKKNGFDGEIQLQVEELPAGVTASCGKILGGKAQDGCIVLSAAEDAKPIAKSIRIGGVATITAGDQSRDVFAAATVYQETYQPGGGRGHWPVYSHVVSVGKPGDIREVNLSTYELTLKPGESKSIDVEIERADGFDKNVTLEVIYKHLSSVYGDPFPQGVTVEKSASKVLLTAGQTKGKITLKAAANAQLAEKQLFTVMANVSINFVMKATYASDPVYVTVEK